jgi:hypothetical protein
MSSNRRRIFGVAAAAALAVSGAAGVSASSAGTSHATRIHLVGGAGNGANAVVGGQLDTNRHCLRMRKVTMYKETSSGWAPVDAILSSAHGAWGFHYQSNDPDPTQVKFTVTRDTRDGVVCEEDDRLATLSPSPRAGTRAAGRRADGGTTTYPTSIDWRAGVVDDTAAYWIEIGQLGTNEVCQGLRKVIVFVNRGHGYRRTDTVLSSPEGVWAFHIERTENNATEDVRWVVTPDTRRNGSVVCKGAELEQTV